MCVMCKEMENEVKNLKQENEKVKIENATLKEELENLKSGLEKFFSTSQMKLLKGAKKVVWDEETLKKAVLVKTICGNRKMEFIRTLLPFPTSKTVRWHLAKIPFDIGIQLFTLEILKRQCDELGLQNFERQFVLGMDCKALKAGVQTDPSTGQKIGFTSVTPTQACLKKNSLKIATNAQVGLLMGLGPRIKKVVNFELVAGASEPIEMAAKVKNVLKETEERGGVQICAIAVDQGPDNISFLNQLGLKYTRVNYTHFVPHPNGNARRLYISPDLVHVSKNLTSNFRHHRVKFARKLQEQFNLSSPYADFNDVIKLYHEQENIAIKLAPRLKKCSIAPDHFETMKEEVAYSVLSPEVRFGIELMTANESGKRNSTSFFLEHLDNLQNIFNNPLPWSKSNLAQYRKDIEYLTFLKDVFFPNIEYEFVTKKENQPIVVKKGHVTSVTGAMVAISVLIDLSADQFAMGAEEFLPKNVLTNAVENLFSQVTLKSAKPTALEFKQILKAISVCGYEVAARDTYYSKDSTEVLNVPVNFFSMAKDFVASEVDDDCGNEIDQCIEKLKYPEDVFDSQLFSSDVQLFGFHSMAIGIITSLEKQLSKCDECYHLIRVEDVDANNTKLSDTARKLFSLFEWTFRAVEVQLGLSNPIIEDAFMANIMSLDVFDHCFTSLHVLAEKFFKIRFNSVLPTTIPHLTNYFASRLLAN
jgi:hypothetical protein